MRRVALIATLLAAAGCNAVFGLDPVGLGDGDAAAGDDAAIGDRDADDAAGGDDAAGSDGDNDGVPDAIDNCPFDLNRHQDDADADGKGDVCDLCPGTFDGSTPINIDNDQIGDRCGDPSSATKQCVVWFDGFGAARTASRYTSPAGQTPWQISGGTARQIDVGATDALLYLSGVAFRPSVVVTRAVVVSRAPITGTATWEVGAAAMVTDTNRAVPSGAFGLLTQEAAATNGLVTARRHLVGSNDEANAVDALRPIVDGTAATIAADARGALAARVRFDDATVTLTATAIAVVGGTGAAGLRTQHVTAAFDYLLVIEDALGGCPPRVEP